MDPKTLNLDPAFLLNLDPDPGFCQFWRKKFKNSFFNRIFLFNYKKERNRSRRNFWSVKSMNGEFLSSILHLLPLICHIFTGVDPDPYSEYGSTKFMNTDTIWIRIRIHKTGYNFTSRSF